MTRTPDPIITKAAYAGGKIVILSTLTGRFYLSLRLSPSITQSRQRTESQRFLANVLWSTGAAKSDLLLTHGTSPLTDVRRQARPQYWARSSLHKETRGTGLSNALLQKSAAS